MLRVCFEGNDTLRSLSHPEWAPKIVKSVAYMLQSNMKKLAKSGKAPDGSAYGSYKRMSETLRARLENRPVRSDNGPLGRLVNAIGYESDGDDVVLGWLSKWGAKHGDDLQKGFTRDVTDSVRKKFAAAGLRPPSSRIVVRPYNFIHPAYQQFESKIAPHINKKLLSYLKSGAPTDKKGRRKYKVYSK